jgi:hypothetical protein
VTREKRTLPSRVWIVDDVGMVPALVLVLLLGCTLAVWKDLAHERSDVSDQRGDAPLGRRERAGEAVTRRSLRSFLPRSRKPVLPREDRAPLAGHISCSDISDYVASGYQGIVVHLMQADRRRRA